MRTAVASAICTIGAVVVAVQTDGHSGWLEGTLGIATTLFVVGALTGVVALWRGAEGWAIALAIPGALAAATVVLTLFCVALFLVAGGPG